MDYVFLFDFSGTFEVNFMDDVGQTLLNWASAFGTLEMVSFETCADFGPYITSFVG